MGTMSALQSLSDELAAAVERGGAAIAAVHARHRVPSSGVHWTSGVIVTADHTLERVDGITVTFGDGKRRAASLAGRDPTTDIAVLKLADAAGAPVAVLSAGPVRPGHLVLAVGRSDDGLSATMGVISAVGEAWNTWRGGRVDKLVRADVTPFHGFSGGALVDASGSVIGLNTTGLSRHAAVTLPEATVTRVCAALLEHGRIARGYLGLAMQPVRIPERLVSELKLATKHAAIVVAVENGQAAERAGVLIGDVLVGLDGNPVEDVEDVQMLLGPERVGKPLTLRVVRAGALTDVRVVVGERDTDDE